MNYFFVTLSQVIGNPILKPEYEYRIDNSEEKYKGKVSNDAPLKYVQDKVGKRKEIIDKYILIVTEECKNIIEGTDFTSIDYYKKQIVDNMQSLFNKYDSLANVVKNKGYNDLLDYVEKSVLLVNNDGDLNSKIFEMFDKYDDEYKNVFMDISGGSRDLPMQLSLILYYLKYKNSNIEELVYATRTNISGGYDTKINTFTDKWKKIINSIEDEEVKTSEVAKTKHEEEITGKIKSKEYHEVVKAIDINNDSLEKALTNKAKDESAKKAHKTVDKFNDSKDKEVIKQVNKLKNKAKQVKRNDAFETLKKAKDTDLIIQFFEKITEIFKDKHIVECKYTDSKMRLSDALDAVYNYYYSYFYDKNGRLILKNCVYKQIQCMCKELKKGVNPHDFYENYLNISFKNIYSDKMSKQYGKYSTQGANYKMSNDIYEKIANGEISLNGQNDAELIKDYIRVQYIYFNHGFPFACRKKDVIYPEVQNYYLTEFKKLIETLDDLKNNNYGEYRRTLDRYYQNPRKAMEIMPYQLLFKVDTSKFNDIDYANSLLEKLYERRKKTSDYRNRLSHDKESVRSDETARLAEEIRSWLTEYQEKLK